MLLHPRTKISLATGLSAVLGACTLTLTLASASASEAAPARTPTVLSVTRVAVDDAYVDSRHPFKATGRSGLLVASKSVRRTQTSLVKFRVPATPAGLVLRDARLQLRVSKSTRARVLVTSVSNRWRGGTLSYRKRVQPGRVVASALVDGKQSSLDLRVRSGLTAGTVTFALGTTNGAMVVTSREGRSTRAPRLVLSYQRKTTPPFATIPIARSAAPTAPVATAALAPTPVTPVKIGMSAPASQWSARLGEVGRGVTARRIFADLASGPNSQMSIIDQAFKAGMMPVISYKVGGDVAGAKAGRYDAAAKQAAAAIAAYGKPATVTIWHEPQGDVSAADFVAIQKRLVPLFKVGQIKVGPLLNGWLLDRQADTTFASFAPNDLMRLWDFMGIDTYESGTLAAPGAVKPADRIPLLVNFEKKRGFSHPLVVGEYNGYSGKSIRDAGQALLNTPQVWFGCMWNSTTGKGYTLTGDRLTAFRETLADATS